MTSHTPIEEQLLSIWLEEFNRSAEMLTGKQQVAVSSPSEALPSGRDLFLWIKHTFTSDESFAVYVGARGATWSAWGESPGEDSTEALRSTYLELLNKTQQATASVLSARLGKTITCSEGEVLAPAGLDAAALAIFSVTVGQGELPPLFWAADLAAAALLADGEIPAVVSSSAEENAADLSAIGRVLDLQLTASVTLGSASLAIKDVLKITPGSYVELKKDAEEPADLLVNGTVVARGHVVLVNGNYGVRITEIIRKADRLQLCRNNK